MKKLISVLILVAIMASFCTVSAFADDVVSLQAAIDNAPGTAITLGSAITVNDIETLDLKGCTVSYTSTTPGEAMITNNGGLTITDTVGGGKLTFEYVGESAGYIGNVGSCTIVNRGSLVVSGGTVENTTNKSNHFSAAIDNNSTVSNASVTINGGSVVGTASAMGVRQYSNSTSCSNSVTVSSGTVSGSRGVSMQIAASGAPTSLSIGGGYISGSYGVVTTGDVSAMNNTSVGISGGTVNGIVDIGSKDTQISGGTFSGGYIYHRDTSVVEFITGGSFSKDSVEYFDNYVAPDFEQKDNGNGGFTVEEPEFDLQKAVDESSSSGAAITLPENIIIEESVKIPNEAKIVINLKDSTFDNDITAASGVSSIFTLGEKASVTIENVTGTADELNLMRSMLSKDYCVRQGSIIVDDSHELKSDGSCKKCGLQIVSNTYGVPATADNSNMPLWSVLFIAFAAVALLTGKKRRA